MPGHLFIVQGDLTRLACDAWLLPTSPTLWVEEYWLRFAPAEWKDRATKRGPNDPWLEPGRVVRIFSSVVPLPDSWESEDVRTVEAVEWTTADNRQRPWLTSMAIRPDTPAEKKAQWFAEGARQFVHAAANACTDARARMAASEAEPNRIKPLLALPVVGTGQGGGSEEAGIILRTLIRALVDVLQNVNADVVLVTHSADKLAAAQQARRDIENASDSPDLWGGLSPDLKKIGRELAAKSTTGDLVLFLGAGVSVSAGLPTWTQLLNGLADDARFDESAKKDLRSLQLVDQAHLIRSRLEQPEDRNAEAIPLSTAISRRITSDYYGLQHALLANLPVRESATTNYDILYEDASRDSNVNIAVLPYESAAGADRWLLKLHGCIKQSGKHAEDIVLTREDYLRYADRRGALAGIVQALLITRHMLFVGFSLTDENFHRIVDEVRKVRPTSNPSDQNDPPKTFGTALLLGSSPLLETLWRNDIKCVALDDNSSTASVVGMKESTAQRLDAANRLEILLDFISFLANRNVSHILDTSYDGLLSEGERELRDHVRNFARAISPHMRKLPAWVPIAEMLKALGLKEPPPE